MNFQQQLSLDVIRQELIRLEDSIIFSLIERCQFSHNSPIYTPDAIPGLPSSDSFLHFFLHEIESAHAKVRRYSSPDELPFTADLPDPILPPMSYPSLLIPNTVNLNQKLLSGYTSLITSITRPGDDGNYGSCATKDTEVLQLLSRRIHFGKFVAEAKFNGVEHEAYVQLIGKADRVGIEALLTKRQVEVDLLVRLREKARVYGMETDNLIDSGTFNCTVDIDAVVALYRDFVIPLTKEVEVEYLLVRCDFPDFVPDF